MGDFSSIEIASGRTCTAFGNADYRLILNAGIARRLHALGAGPLSVRLLTGRGAAVVGGAFRLPTGLAAARSYAKGGNTEEALGIIAALRSKCCTVAPWYLLPAPQGQ